ncbi:IS3 family transposase [Nitriliruptoraceae bacterium ZYF776]|nr:IS3 family transposase [Profundirhabdus halotolerans]
MHGPWRTRTEAELAVLEYINWFNTARLHGELDHVPPREYEEAHYRQHHPGTGRGRDAHIELSTEPAAVQMPLFRV